MPRLLLLRHPSALLAVYLAATCAVQLEVSAVGLVRWSDYSVLAPLMAAALLPVRHTLIVGACTLAGSVAIYGFVIPGVSEGGRTVVIAAALLSFGMSLLICRVRLRQKAGCVFAVRPGRREETGRIVSAPREATGDPCAFLWEAGPAPGRLPQPAAMELAYCRTDDGRPQAHWLDAIPLSGARVALVAGSVTEDGEPAPALVPELRAAVRTLADIDVQPDEALTHLHDVIRRLRPDESTRDVTASCLYAVYDPVTADCTLACAGHPAPSVIAPDGVITAVDLPAGVALGRARAKVGTAEIRLRKGSVLLLPSHSAAPPDPGKDTDRLEAPEQLVDPKSSLTDTCRAALEAFVAAGAPRRLHVLAARTRTLDGTTVATWDLPADPAAVSAARQHVTATMRTWGLDDATSTTVLIVSELVTNAIRHAQPPVRLRLIRCATGLTCEVTDGSTTSPHLRRACTFDESGRGLFIVAQLTQRWGTRHHPQGKTIWAEHAYQADEPVGEEEQALRAGLVS
ncbi:ATP-binding SpoIIE family protein phosphatase [Streptomyces sp. MI02-7b]|uniref:ATP-binding SpoIIE family protein phosphatase n=1 Tax=Streptomyces sp. MI02-7b TaxID=462941 RepID=UPI0029B4533B|nr:ATP-binding SpoIIE family protein phosphatase [Streptomyces sp. MI02-7b]MDX3074170.1 serine/threonine-protein phosphatase [Streptomyces sp. MI02-7b]